MRIRRLPLKILFAAALTLAGIGLCSLGSFPVAGYAGAMGGSAETVSVSAGSYGVLLLFPAIAAVCSRVFRGSDEAKNRPWWRATFRPAGGFVLAALFALSVIPSAVILLSETLAPRTNLPFQVVAFHGVDPIGSVVWLAVSILGAWYYARSSARLRTRGAVAVA